MSAKYGIVALTAAAALFSLSCQGKVGEEKKVEREEIILPEPRVTGKMPLEEAIAKRRSRRRFTPQELTREELSQLLWSAAGITDKMRGFRAAPSAGATYPMEIYAVTPEGLFRYLPQGHKLLLLAKDDLRRKLAGACLGQGFVAEAPVDIVIAAVYRRTTGGYGKRGIRYVHIEVGHIAENIHLEAVALGLGSVPIGAFEDESVKKVLGLPREEEPLYVIPVGHVSR